MVNFTTSTGFIVRTIFWENRREIEKYILICYCNTINSSTIYYQLKGVSQTHCQLSKFTIRDMPCKPKLNSLVDTWGLTDCFTKIIRITAVTLGDIIELNFFGAVCIFAMSYSYVSIRVATCSVPHYGIVCWITRISPGRLADYKLRVHWDEIELNCHALDPAARLQHRVEPPVYIREFLITICALDIEYR